MFTINHYLDRFEIVEYLMRIKTDPRDNSLSGFIWFDFDDVIVGEKPSPAFPHPYEPEDINYWIGVFWQLERMQEGESHRIEFLCANRLSFVYTILDNGFINIKHYHDDDILWEKEFSRITFFEETHRFEASIKKELLLAEQQT